METLLLNALKPGIDVTDELKYMSEKYAEDVNVTLLKAQLPVCEKDLISEIFTVFKLILVNPATNAVSERSISTARHLKAWLRSSMNQIRFNNLATLMIHSDRTANIDLDEVASEFASRNDNRKRHFGI